MNEALSGADSSLGGLDRSSQLKGENRWICCCSMSATIFARTSEQDMTCDDNIHAKVTKECAEEHLAVRAQHAVLPRVYAYRSVTSWLFWIHERLHFLMQYCM